MYALVGATPFVWVAYICVYMGPSVHISHFCVYTALNDECISCKQPCAVTLSLCKQTNICIIEPNSNAVGLHVHVHTYRLN